MCGLFGYLGHKQALPILFEGLKKLEYRGYDSVGVAVNSGKDIFVEKIVGKVEDLKNNLAKKSVGGKIGVAHTRWATHGRVTLDNCHPFWDCQKNVAVVHNGIIENYLELKKTLEKKGHQFLSATDSEVIAHLVEEFLKKTSFSEAVRLAARQLKGAFAIIAISKTEPHCLIAARKNSPLVIGIGQDEYFLASDRSALAEKAGEALVLADEELAIISEAGIQLMNFDGDPIFKLPEKINFPAQFQKKNGYATFMLKEIEEEPYVIREIIKNRISSDFKEINFGELNLTSKELGQIKRIILTGCGSSYYAAMVAEYWLEEYLRIPVEVEYAAEFRYRQPVVDKRSLVIVLSQSGETADTLAALREAKKSKAPVWAISNVRGSSLLEEADRTIFTGAGLEIGVAATKTFTSQLAVLYLLALYLAKIKRRICAKELEKKLQNFKFLPEQIEAIFLEKKKIYEIAQRISHSNNALYLGRGKGFPIALEGALKLKEISYIHAEGYPAAEMKHGPIALVDEDMPVVVLALAGRRYEKILNNIEEIKARGGYVIAIATQGDAVISRKADEVFSVPETSEDLSPILAVVPLQLLAYFVALRRGCDVDQPRNLAKSVTVE